MSVITSKMPFTVICSTATESYDDAVKVNIYVSERCFNHVGDSIQ